MKQNEAIEVVRCENGFIVQTAMRDKHGCYPLESMKVFQTMSSLEDFIESHFDWPEKDGKR